LGTSELQQAQEEEVMKDGGPVTYMSVRTYLAGKALQGILAGDIDDTWTPEDYAVDAVKLADAMIAELERK
jgi:hypothetical protein